MGTLVASDQDQELASVSECSPDHLHPALFRELVAHHLSDIVLLFSLDKLFWEEFSQVNIVLRIAKASR